MLLFSCKLIYLVYPKWLLSSSISFYGKSNIITTQLYNLDSNRRILFAMFRDWFSFVDLHMLNCTCSLSNVFRRSITSSICFCYFHKKVHPKKHWLSLHFTQCLALMANIYVLLHSKERTTSRSLIKLNYDLMLFDTNEKWDCYSDLNKMLIFHQQGTLKVLKIFHNYIFPARIVLSNFKNRISCMSISEEYAQSFKTTFHKPNFMNKSKIIAIALLSIKKTSI